MGPDLFSDPTIAKRRVLLVDTIPKDARNQGSINLGLEIVRKRMDADVCPWWTVVPDIGRYDTIGFNVFYPMHLLNVVPFLTRNRIQPLRTERCLQPSRPQLIAGGPGAGLNHILSGIVDSTCVGEYDLAENYLTVTSEPVISGGKAVIELTRGCRHRCRFCEYSWTCNSYREKSLDLVKEQIEWVRNRGITRINFLSANFAGHSEIGPLIEHAISRGITILNSDIAPRDVSRILPWLKHLPKYLKLGVESFDPRTRSMIGKPMTDDDFLTIVDALLEHCNGLHFYLIYGLPDDRYDRWFMWLRRLAEIRRHYTVETTDLFGEKLRENTKAIRMEFSITNFEPALGTPLEQAPRVDFDAKAAFLRLWTETLIATGFFKNREVELVDYKNARGRFGRKELSYEMLMSLKNGGPELTEELIHALPHGVGRSVSDEEAARFLHYGRRDG